MPYYNIANLVIDMDPHHKRLVKNGIQYLADKQDVEPDIKISVTDAYLKKFQMEQPHLSLTDCEYIILGGRLASELLNFDAVILHASAVMYDGFAYLFSAKSGTGKSTHTGLWQKYFGCDNTVMINDDKPVIRYIDGNWCACGSPFCGKDDISNNIVVPIKGICFISRGESNSISPMTKSEAVFKIFNQTLRPSDPERMDKLFSVVGNCLTDIPVYSLTCNMTLEAVKTAYEGMNSDL